jgi:hypothetical protein
VDYLLSWPFLRPLQFVWITVRLFCRVQCWFKFRNLFSVLFCFVHFSVDRSCEYFNLFFELLISISFCLYCCLELHDPFLLLRSVPFNRCCLLESLDELVTLLQLLRH